MDMTSVFAEITKSTPQEDGSLLVEGLATDSSLDLDQQRCDGAWLDQAMPDWFKIGNIREQHDSKRAVGKAMEHENMGGGAHRIVARVVDPVAIAKTHAGVFTGFSIGIRSPRISKSADAPNGVINGGQIVEVSLVDRPCNPNATLTVCKAAAAGWEGSPADLDEERGLVKCEELAFDVAEETVEKTTDVDHLEAPAPGQVCVDCNEDGHLNCGPTDKTIEGGDTGDKPAVAPEFVLPEAVKTVEEAQQVADELLELAKGAANEVTIVEFDAEAAKTLVAETLAKADVPPVYNDEQSDILNAQAAIAIIGKLIVSEASELVNNPAEACDIQILLSAVGALRCFIGREQQQSLGENEVCADSPEVMLAAEADAEKKVEVTKGKYSADELRQMVKDGKAMANADGEPSYPIGDADDLERAIHAVGRGKADHAAIREHIEKNAKRLGLQDKIPGDWTGLKAAAPESEPIEADTTKTAEPEAVKAADVSADPDVLVKALTAALEKADNPLRKLFVGIVEASTEITAKSVSDLGDSLSELGERLVKVEGMATPGGPALRRTQAERKQAQQSDLVMEAARFKALAAAAEDPDLRKGYATKAVQIEAQVKALAQ